MELCLRDICGSSARPCKKNLGAGILDNSSTFLCRIITIKAWETSELTIESGLLSFSFVYVYYWLWSVHDELFLNRLHARLMLGSLRPLLFSVPLVLTTTRISTIGDKITWPETVLKWVSFGKQNNPHPSPSPASFQSWGVCFFPLVALDGGRKPSFSLFYKLM